LKEQIETRELNTKTSATLLAHVTGFAAINCGGAFQHLDFLKRHPWMTFLIVPGMYIFQIMSCRLLRSLRLNIIHENNKHVRKHLNYDQHQFVPLSVYEQKMEEEPEKYGKAYALRVWDEEVYESENDVAGLCISFLTVQACRFVISGVLPDVLGIEEEHYLHPVECVYKLASCILFFAVCTAVIQFLYGRIFGEVEVTPGTCASFFRRMLQVQMSASAMCTSWCIMYVGKWQMARIITPDSPNQLHARVILAIVLSAAAGVTIFFFDRLADDDCTDSNADQAIFQAIESLGLGVGFAWEQSFDGALEILAEQSTLVNPVVVELILAILVALVVIEPWRLFILSKVIRMGKEWMERQKAEEAATKLAENFRDGYVKVDLTSARTNNSDTIPIIDKVQ